MQKRNKAFVVIVFDFKIMELFDYKYKHKF